MLSMPTGGWCGYQLAVLLFFCVQSRRALMAAKSEFDAQNSLLLEELPRLYDSRVDYFQPSLQAFVNAQVTHQYSCQCQ